MLFFRNKDKDQEPVVRTLYVLGTIAQFKVYGNKAEEAIEDAIDRLSQIDDKMSVFKEYSEISKINMNAGRMPQIVSEDVFELLKKSVAYSEFLEGTFDPTIRPLVDLWGIGTKKENIPSIEEISKMLSLVNYKDIILENSNKAVMLKKKNEAIDLGGIAKGYAADEVRTIFVKHNIKSALIDLGGNIFVLGKKPNKQLWSVGIQDPSKRRGEFVCIVNAKNKSIVTSGNYEKFFIKGDKKYHHILDSRTGYPSENEVDSVTVISDDSIDGDGLTTGLYILGVEKSMKLLDHRKGIDAIFVTKDKKIYATPGAKKNCNFVSDEYTYVE